MKKIVILFLMLNMLCFSNTENQDENGGVWNTITKTYNFFSKGIKGYHAVQKISFEVQYQSALMEDTKEKRVIELKKLEEGIKSLSKKDTVKLYYQLGYNNIDLNEGVDYYTKVILLNPENLKAYCGRAINKRSLGDDEGAMLDFSKVIELDPNILGAYNYRAEIYLKKKEFKLALKDLSNVVGGDENFYINMTWGNYQMFKLFLKKEKLFNSFNKKDKIYGLEEIERRFKVKDGIQII